MRKETNESSVSLIEFNSELGEWYVRWDFKEKEEGVNWYEEELFLHIPTIDEIKKAVTSWHNRQIDGAIKNGFSWDGDKVIINEESKFNYKATFDLAVLLEQQIAAWDASNPELAGKTTTTITNEEGGEMEVPSGRPRSLFPITFKFANDYHTFNTLADLQSFYVSMLQHIQGQYTAGWILRDSFDFAPYEEALGKL